VLGLALQFRDRPDIVFGEMLFLVAFGSVGLFGVRSAHACLCHPIYLRADCLSTIVCVGTAKYVLKFGKSQRELHLSLLLSDLPFHPDNLSVAVPFDVVQNVIHYAVRLRHIRRDGDNRNDNNFVGVLLVNLCSRDIEFGPQLGKQTFHHHAFFF